MSGYALQVLKVPSAGHLANPLGEELAVSEITTGEKSQVINGHNGGTSQIGG